MSEQILIDFDSKIPNLALMKLSSWAKERGDNVSLFKAKWIRKKAYLPIDFTLTKADEAWLSCIFTWHKEEAMKVKHPTATMHYGGTGFDWGIGDGLNFDQRIALPLEIESQKPDYSLYDDDRAIGFCLRGCNRTCGFCDVWRKEGRIIRTAYRPISEWVPDGFTKVCLLDNDIALQPDDLHDKTILDCRNSGRKLSITQGYDIRCVTPQKAAILAENKPYDIKFGRHCLYFAWDKMSSEKAVRRNVPMLIDAGFKGSELFCYMICGYNTTFEEDYYRYKTLWEEFGVYPFVMTYNNRADDKRLRQFARWVNRRRHKKHTFDEYQAYFKDEPFSEIDVPVLDSYIGEAA